MKDEERSSLAFHRSYFQYYLHLWDEIPRWNHETFHSFIGKLFRSLQLRSSSCILASLSVKNIVDGVDTGRLAQAYTDVGILNLNSLRLCTWRNWSMLQIPTYKPREMFAENGIVSDFNLLLFGFQSVYLL